MNQYNKAIALCYCFPLLLLTTSMIRTAEETTTRLTLAQGKQSNRLIGRCLAALSGIPLVAAAIAAYSFSETVELSCQRLAPTQPSCILTRSRVFGLVQHHRVFLHTLKQVQITQSVVPETKGSPLNLFKAPPTQLISLVDETRNRGIRKVPFSTYRLDDPQSQIVTKQINTFLNTTDQRSLIISSSHQQQVIVMTALLLTLTMATGALLYKAIVFGTGKEHRFDQLLGQLVIKEWNVLTSTITKYQLNDIAGIQVEYLDQHHPRLTLIFTWGERHTVAKFYGFRRCEEALQTANRIRNFLLQTSGKPSKGPD
jgi:hypothetical protein